MSQLLANTRLPYPLYRDEKQTWELNIKNELPNKYYGDGVEDSWSFLSVEEDRSEELAKKILDSNGNNNIILNTSLRIGDPEINVSAQVFYKGSEELLKIIEYVKAMPYVKNVEWSETVRVVGINNICMLERLFDSLFCSIWESDNYGLNSLSITLHWSRVYYNLNPSFIFCKPGNSDQTIYFKIK